MQPFSVASVAASCSTISTRSLASAAELDDILESSAARGSPAESLASVHALLHHISSQTKQLQEQLTACDSIPETLRADLPRLLAMCESALAILDKQLRRLHSVSPELKPDSRVLRSYARYLDIQTQIFESYKTALARKTVEEREELLQDEDVVKAVSAAKHAAGIIMQRADILIPRKGSPPSYTPSSPVTAESAKVGGFLAGLTETFHAMTAAMRPKPEPFVVPLCQAALRGDLVQLKGLLAHGVNVDGRNEEGSTALICATKELQHAAVRFLVANGASVSVRDRSGFLPLFRATETGDLEMISLLLSLGANPNERSSSGEVLLVDVAAKGPLPLVSLLLDKGADIHAHGLHGNTIFANAVKAENMPLIKLLASRGADIRATDSSGNSPLAVSVLNSNMELTRFLLDRGASVSTRANDGRSLLAVGVEQGRLDLVELLLGKGADANITTTTGERIFVDVLKTGSLPMTTLFTDRGVDINFTSRFGGSDGTTPLLYAITRDQWDIVELLIRRGANPNTPDKKGRTPLLEALQMNHPRTVALLLQNGADINQEGMMTPAAFARLSGQCDLMEVLRSGGGRALAAADPVRASATRGSRQTRPSARPAAKDEEAPPDYDSVTGLGGS